MKKVLLFVIILIFIAAIVQGISSSPGALITNLEKYPVSPIKEMHYKIKLFAIIPVGDAIINSASKEEYMGKAVYHLSASAKSLQIISQFFSAAAQIDSYIDLNGLSPLLFRQKLSLKGKPTVEKSVYYDQENNQMSIGEIRRSILPNTQDPLSAIFNLRRMDFARTDKFEMNINTNQKNYILSGTASLKEIALSNKKYQLVYLKAKIRRRDKNPYHQSSIDMVLLKDRENIPLLIKVFASGVLIKATLADIRQ